MEAYKKGEGVELRILWCDVTDDDIAGNFDILDVTGPAVGVGLTFSVLESAVGLVAIGDDKSVRALIGPHSKGLGSTNE
jgi:hypothetical protein